MSLYKQVLLLLNSGYSIEEIINEFAEQGVNLKKEDE
jgi:hypothetical protein